MDTVQETVTIQDMNSDCTRWYEDWSTLPETKNAMEMLKTASPSSVVATATSLETTKRRIIYACYSADHYQEASDVNAKYRAAIANQKKTLSALVRAAHTLACASERGDRAMDHSFPRGRVTGVRLQLIGDVQTMPVTEMLARWFKELERNLSAPMIELDTSFFVQDHTQGNLRFPKSRRGAGKKTDVATMLAFALTIYLRMYNSGKPSDGIAQGEAMPRFGKPCTSIVRSFVNATLSKNFDDKAIADLLRKMPKGTVLMDWPRRE